MLIRLLTIFAISAAIATGVNQFRPTGKLPWVGDWSHLVETKALEEGLALATVEQVRKMASSGLVILLDARPRLDYESGRIPGAMMLPYDELDLEFPNIQPFLSPGQKILTYCSGEACDDSFMVSVFLKEQGYTNIVLFAGGINAWVEAGHEVEGAL